MEPQKNKRVYRKLGMVHRSKIKRRIPSPARHVLLQQIQPKLTWSMDFMEDRLANGRKFRTFNIIDDYNREALALNVVLSFPSSSVVEMVKRVIRWRGKTEQIRTDHRTEFIAKAFKVFWSNSGIEHIKIQKGNPMQN